jgi:hypothetical protein
MASTVVIGTRNYSGETANITFYPETGGTINVGSHIVPYNYSTEYFFGTYELYFSAYNFTCQFVISSITTIPSAQTITATTVQYTNFERYTQDPENFSDIDLSGTTFSGLNTNILINKYFAGTFDGAISQFRMYVSPLSAPEVKHNFSLLKNPFIMFNPDCPDCSTDTCQIDDFTYAFVETESIEPPFEIKPSTELLGRMYIPDSRDKNYLIKDNFEYLMQIVRDRPIVNKFKVTPTRTKTPLRPTPTRTPSPSITPTKSRVVGPTPTPTKTPQITSKYWDANGWWGNQRNTPQCVGFSWAHWIEDGPVEHSGTPPIVLPSLIYTEAQKIDEWPGENYNGTSVRAGAKYLQSRNMIKSYYWGYDINVLTQTILNLGPVVVGSYWYSGMFYPDNNGVINITGGIVGGHAYVVNGVDTVKKQFRIKNSWGQTWGKQGHAFISFTDMARLISMNGEVCLAIENNF